MQENIRKFDEAAGKAGCPILAVPLFLRQGWETTKAGCPILAVPLFLRQGWDTTKASPVLVFAFAGCPILAVPLFLRQGWDTTKASPVLSFAFAGCPILAVPLFLRQGWDTTKASPVLSFGSSAALYPRQNVAKSVAKARKSHQVTTSQPQPHQRHRMDLPLKEPHPPLFDENEASGAPWSFSSVANPARPPTREFEVVKPGYSSAECSPAGHASASPTAFRIRHSCSVGQFIRGPGQHRRPENFNRPPEPRPADTEKQNFHLGQDAVNRLALPNPGSPVSPMLTVSQGIATAWQSIIASQLKIQ